jgi:transposase
VSKVDRNNPKRSRGSESTYTLMEFMREFPDDDACLEWLWRTRCSEDGKHAHCPKCERQREFKRYATKERRQSWTCQGCGYHLHPTAGTIFHKSSTSLHLWFYAMHLMTSTRCGISAKQLERELGVTYKTAWRMANLIRNELMVQDDEPFDGEVEADETYVGGRRRGGKRGRPSEDSHKVPVFGMVQRSGHVAAVTVRNAKAKSLMPHLRKRVLPKAVVYTDELRSYDGLKRAGYQHRRIHHAEKVYVSGDVHTNTIEGFWSLMKRGINGVYHAVSAKHLQGYLNEYTFRYNHRSKADVQFKKLLLRAASGS